MKEFKSYNTLVKYNDGACLCNAADIRDVVYGSEIAYAQLYELDSNGLITAANQNKEFEECDFAELYEEYTDWDEECGHEKYILEDVYGETKAYVKADWHNYEHYTCLYIRHGINEDSCDITDDEIIPGECFMADNYIPQDYPKTEHQSFFKFVADSGDIYYIKCYSAFFPDSSSDTYEIITEDEFNEYED